MKTIKIYGSPRSSASRCFVMLEECGLKYENVVLDMDKNEHKSEAFLKLNPNGKVPCLADGDYSIWESGAILFYLAEKYKPEMLGKSPEDKGHVHQWCFWAMNECQPPLVDLLIQRVFVPENKRDLDLIVKREKQLPEIFKILDEALAGKAYLVGENYSVADVMLASVVSMIFVLEMKLEAYPNLISWLTKTRARPAFQAVLKLRGDA